MPTYVRIKNNQIVTQVPSKADLPATWRYDDGRSVSGFNLMDDPSLADAGWVPVTMENKPAFDSNTQQLVNERINLVSGKPVRTWDVAPIPAQQPGNAPPPAPSLEDRIAALEAAHNGMVARATAANVTSPDSIKMRAAIIGP